MKHLSFKDYYENKERLKRAGVENVRTNIEYSITKYCKIPVVESYESEKSYISLKPKDKVKILWEYESDTPILKRLVIVSEDEKEFIPCWTSNKMFEWTTANCKQIKALV
jgi:hypothetical protein